MSLKETVTVTREVSPRIADLVYFAKSLSGKDIKSLSDEELIRLAKDFWESRHGEDD
jgi:hypothetical protein